MTRQLQRYLTCACGKPKANSASRCMACLRIRQAQARGQKRVPKRCGCMNAGLTRTPWHCACARWKRSTDAQCEVCDSGTFAVKVPCRPAADQPNSHAPVAGLLSGNGRAASGGSSPPVVSGGLVGQEGDS